MPPRTDMNEEDRPLAALALRPPRAPHVVSGQSPLIASDLNEGDRPGA